MTENTQLNQKQYGRPEDERIIPFMKIAMPAALFSILLTVASIFFIATKGLNLGLDFTGGVAAELNYTNPVKPEDVSKALNQAGFNDAVVQTLGSERDLMVRMPVQEDIEAEDLTKAVTAAVQLPNNAAEVPKVDIVGGQGIEIDRAAARRQGIVLADVVDQHHDVAGIGAAQVQRPETTAARAAIDDHAGLTRKNVGDALATECIQIRATQDSNVLAGRSSGGRHRIGGDALFVERLDRVVAPGISFGVGLGLRSRRNGR